MQVHCTEERWGQWDPSEPATTKKVKRWRSNRMLVAPRLDTDYNYFFIEEFEKHDCNECVHKLACVVEPKCFKFFERVKD